MSLMLFNSYYFITKQYDLLDRGIKETQESFVLSQKKLIKREVDSIIDFIEFKLNDMPKSFNEKQLQYELSRWINSIRFGKKNDNYIFVYELENPEGGDNFAKMLINPNRPDLVGKYISDSYKDSEGKQFRKIFIKEIKLKGSSFVTYTYKKLDENAFRPKISYFRLYPKWNWVIAAGAYLDDIDVQIAQKKAVLKKTVQLEVTSAIIIFLFFSLIANAFAIFLGKRIEIFLNAYNDEVKKKTAELEEFNKTLERRVHEEVIKAREQEQLLIQKSKFIALGEMISNIAHQWRQPLSQLSALLMTIKFKYKLGQLNNAIIDEKSQEAENLLEYMSKTIDDFREFFMPKKEKKEFSIKSAIDSVINIIGESTKNRNISLEINIDAAEVIEGYKNEFEQVLLNILTNAKQILFYGQVAHPYIKIDLQKDAEYIYLSIEDNGGGIKVEPREKIFEPYVTTKEDTGGTGIGLYMSKLIIEKRMGGVLSVTNTKDGAKFTIRLKKI
jgi:signal transduction histidine kinase